MNDPNGDLADMDNKIESNVGGQENTPDMDINEKSSKKRIKKRSGKMDMGGSHSLFNSCACCWWNFRL